MDIGLKSYLKEDKFIRYQTNMLSIKEVLGYSKYILKLFLFSYIIMTR